MRKMAMKKSENSLSDEELLAEVVKLTKQIIIMNGKVRKLIVGYIFQSILK